MRGQDPAERIGHGERRPLPLVAENRFSCRVLCLLQVAQRPGPEFHCRGQRARSGSGPRHGDAPQLVGPRLQLRQEQFVGHGDDQLPAVDRFRAFVHRLQLGVQPFVRQEAGAVGGDALPAHEADRIAQHGGASRGVPHFAGRRKDVDQRLQQHVLDEPVGLECFQPIGIHDLAGHRPAGADTPKPSGPPADERVVSRPTTERPRPGALSACCRPRASCASK